MSVFEAVERELKAMPADVAKSAIAAAALAMASELDDPHNSATSKSMCTGKLIDAMDKLRELIPEQPQESALDEIAKRREKRLARASGT